MLRDLLQGKVRLVISYWVFGVIPSILYSVLGLIINHDYIKIIQIPHIRWFFCFYLLFPFIYFPFIYVAIWRSSNNYTKNKLWPILAKIAVGLGIVSIAIGAISIVNQLIHRHDIRYTLNNQIKLINNGLPVKNNNSLFTHISFDNDVIFYDYQLINKDKSQIDVALFAKEIKPKLINIVCSNKELKDYMNKGISLSYRYHDQHNVLIYEYTVKPNECP